LQLLILLLLLLTMHNVSVFFYPCKNHAERHWFSVFIHRYSSYMVFSSIYKRVFMTFFCPWTQDGYNVALELLHGNNHHVW
jgi:hypothetical protein